MAEHSLFKGFVLLDPSSTLWIECCFWEFLFQAGSLSLSFLRSSGFYSVAGNWVHDSDDSAARSVPIPAKARVTQVGLQGARLDRLRVSRKRLAHIPRTHLRHNNGRASADSAPLYLEEVPGGRTCPDGEIFKWVPTHPDSNAHHPSGALGIAHILLLISEPSFAAVDKDISVVIGEQLVSRTATEVKWRLSTLNGECAPTLVLTTPSDREQEHFVEESRSTPGIYEILWRTQPPTRSSSQSGKEGREESVSGENILMAGGENTTGRSALRLVAQTGIRANTLGALRPVRLALSFAGGNRLDAQANLEDYFEVGEGRKRKTRSRVGRPSGCSRVPQGSPKRT
ncbi:hypothetical protein DFH08DRAFT_807546 [Mycena albidolilacea]|uniref:Uncharacterized protein n=1 Tax=Mycena albidolilacea TaxID=1033008 RepID=A0AAD7ETH7_9AGAR|nr:hypothetical protein DFH08DRAFT_807546 [Mycena albidolilacea]